MLRDARGEEAVVVDDDIGVGELADQQLSQGEPDEPRPASDQDVDIALNEIPAINFLA